jgi:two-component system nitrate/nitrite response regulator NarL
MVKSNATLAGDLVTTDCPVAASAAHVGGPVQVLLSQDQPILLIIEANDEHDKVVSEINLFKKQYPRGRVVVLAERSRPNHLVSAYRAGANAYFTKEMSCGAFIKILELIMLGETIVPPEIFAFLCDGQGRPEQTPVVPGAHAPPSGIETDLSPPTIATDALQSLGTDAVPRLSGREKCILRYLIEGYSNKAIARRIKVAEATVKVHVKAILRKIRVSNRTQAAIWAVHNGSFVWSTGADVPLIGVNGHADIGASASGL